MSDFTDFFPAAGATSGGGGASGILKQHVITTSGTIDLTTLGIASGDLIGLFLVGGGYLGTRYNGGQGGYIWRGSREVVTVGTATVTIGAGAASQFVTAGQTTISGGGITSTGSTASGYTLGGQGGQGGGSTYGFSNGNNAGFSQGGRSNSQASGAGNTGTGGGGSTFASTYSSGGSGICIIYYT